MVKARERRVCCYCLLINLIKLFYILIIEKIILKLGILYEFSLSKKVSILIY